MNEQRYFKVSKEAWDSLWHAWYLAGGTETYDRVTRRQALAISRKLERLNPSEIRS